VGGQRHAPAALTPGKTRYPSYRRLGGPHSRSGRVRKISPPQGFNPWTDTVKISNKFPQNSVFKGVVFMSYVHSTNDVGKIKTREFAFLVIVWFVWPVPVWSLSTSTSFYQSALESCSESAWADCCRSVQCAAWRVSQLLVLHAWVQARERVAQVYVTCWRHAATKKKGSRTSYIQRYS